VGKNGGKRSSVSAVNIDHKKNRSRKRKRIEEKRSHIPEGVMMLYRGEWTPTEDFALHISTPEDPLTFQLGRIHTPLEKEKHSSSSQGDEI